eukprot:1965578-Lingulodinium_polyedra.AAC.1
MTWTPALPSACHRWTDGGAGKGTCAPFSVLLHFPFFRQSWQWKSMFFFSVRSLQALICPLA